MIVALQPGALALDCVLLSAETYKLVHVVLQSRPCFHMPRSSADGGTGQQAVCTLKLLGPAGSAVISMPTNQVARRTDHALRWSAATYCLCLSGVASSGSDTEYFLLLI